MKDILWLMNYIAKKSNGIYPDLSCYKYILRTNSHVSFYKHYIINYVIYNEEERIQADKLYFKSKMILRTFKTFFYKRKLKKAIDSDLKHDLYFNDLSDFPENQKITLYISHENTLYNFRISNLIASWVDSLKKTDGLFIKPIKLKNPYTNVPFQRYNLYNIYFGIKNSPFNMNSMILAFFKCNFFISKFIYINFPVLKENAITCFIKSGSIRELYEEIHNMLTEFETEVDYLTLPDAISYSRKAFFVNELLECLRYYLLQAFSCNPLLKRDARKSCKEKLNEYIKNNDISSFIRIRPPPEPIMPPQIFQNSYIPISFNNYTDPPIILEPDDASFDIESIDSADEIIDSILQSDNPFSPTITLPRTPTNDHPTSNNSPFSLTLFNR